MIITTNLARMHVKHRERRGSPEKVILELSLSRLFTSTLRVEESAFDCFAPFANTCDRLVRLTLDRRASPSIHTPLPV